MDSGDENDLYGDKDMEACNYSIDADSDADESDGGDCDYELFIKEQDIGDPEDAKSNRGSKKNYTILEKADIGQRQEDVIAEVSTVLAISRASATILLRHFHWTVSEVLEAWFADEDGVRKRVGLLDYSEPAIVDTDAASDPNPISSDSSKRKRNQIICGICFEPYARNEVVSAACCHFFCRDCWRDYISTSINDGPGCLLLRCPDPSCVASVDRDLVENLVISDDEKEKYSQYLLRSYVEENKKIKWCPGPDCEYAIEFDGCGEDRTDVSCRCYYSFCWSCDQEAHRPADCETVANWFAKNKDESQNTIWILARTKPCPKCKRPIEKNHGCNHMTCNAQCGHQFCWICLQAMKNHGKCNGYNETEAKNSEKGEIYVYKYNHYYGRWAANHSSLRKALADLRGVETKRMQKIIERQERTHNEVCFIMEAWEQIVECRKVLKWTYAYGYYLPEDKPAKKRLFEFLQGEAEMALERLHKCAETELKRFCTDHRPPEEFKEFQKKLKNLTRVTGKYFDKLVGGLENGLSEVEAGGHGKINAKDYWSCDRCTFANPLSSKYCKMCMWHPPLKRPRRHFY